MFTYRAKYPDELPQIEIDNEDNFDDIVEKEELLTHLDEQVRLKLLIYYANFLLGNYFLIFNTWKVL